MRQYRKKNPNQRKDGDRRYRETHREELNKKQFLYMSLKLKKCPEKVKSYYRDYRRQYNKKHPEIYFFRFTIRNMIRFPHRNNLKSCQYVGCSPGFLRNHIESLFQPGMTWENWGEWHIDHIIPISWFPFDKDASLLFVASHWTNLQPMWGAKNVSKGNGYAA